MGDRLSALLDIMDALRDTLDAVLGPDALGAESFQVHGRWNPNPSPPAIDIYPGDPFRDVTAAAFNDVGGELFFTVRARMGAADNQASQELILTVMDDEHALSVAGTLMEDNTLDGLVASLRVDGPSGFIEYREPGGQLSHVGVEWRVMVVNATS